MAAAAALLRITTSSAAPNNRRHIPLPPLPSSPPPHLPCAASAFPFFNLASRALHFSPVYSLAGDGGGGGTIGGGGFCGGGGGGDGDDDDDKSSRGFSILGGWRSRVAADPQFAFKLLMEELVGVTACVMGDMATRPNFGLNELDFVFSTLVVGCILNFALMYILAPTSASAAAASRLPSIFAGCPAGHMFEPGAYSLLHRFGTFVYKGAVFAAVGFAAGLVGTATTNGLIAMRKRVDPAFETPNKPPPTLLNAATWAAHMGVSSNLRYQSLNGLEFVLAKVVPPAVFKVSVVILRCLNNCLGGASFVALARITGSQKPTEAAIQMVESGGVASDLLIEKEKLLVEEKEDDGHLQESHSTDK